ncbi:hypothetical protein WJX81_008285 [Elliptochloris bilobata]|uniref:Sialidase domain-containing protein n=1 Tax=Elliptochloris bilobata TaxID=381761 RepID=A0AAW1RGA0_9CHLO
MRKGHWSIVALWAALLAARTTAAAPAGIEYRWVYRTPGSILDSNAGDTGKGSTNGTVGSLFGQLAANYTPQLRYAHGSTLAMLPNGSLAAAFQATPAPKYWEGADTMGLYWALSNNSGLTWGPTQQLQPPIDNLPLWGPMLFAQNGTTFLVFSGPTPNQCRYKTEVGTLWAPGGDFTIMDSPDSGATWSKPRVLLPWTAEGGVAKLDSNKPAITANGDWLIAFWREQGGSAACERNPEMHGVPGVLLSSDQGKTWKVVDVPARSDTWLIEPAIATYERDDGEQGVLTLFRSRIGVTLQAYSSDGGHTWGPADFAALPNPNSRVDMTNLPNNTLLSAYNDSPTRRTPLALATSQNGGKTWTRVAVVEDATNGSFHYPNVFYLPQSDKVVVIYSVGYPPRLIPAANALGTPMRIAEAASAARRRSGYGLVGALSASPNPGPGLVPAPASAASLQAGAPASGAPLPAPTAHGSPFAVPSRAPLANPYSALIGALMPKSAVTGGSVSGRRLLEGTRADPSVRERSKGRGLGEVARRELAAALVREASQYGRVSYGMRVAVMDRQELVSGALLPGASITPAAAPQTSFTVEG